MWEILIYIEITAETNTYHINGVDILVKSSTELVYLLLSVFL